MFKQSFFFFTSVPLILKNAHLLGERLIFFKRTLSDLMSGFLYFGNEIVEMFAMAIFEKIRVTK